MGISQFYFRSRQHLAAIIARGDLLILEVLRYPKFILHPYETDTPLSNPRHIDISMKELEKTEKILEKIKSEIDSQNKARHPRHR